VEGAKYLYKEVFAALTTPAWGPRAREPLAEFLFWSIL
jgi:hypothetical protein